MQPPEFSFMFWLTAGGVAILILAMGYIIGHVQGYERAERFYYEVEADASESRLKSRLYEVERAPGCSDEDIRFWDNVETERIVAVDTDSVKIWSGPKHAIRRSDLTDTGFMRAMKERADNFIESITN